MLREISLEAAAETIAKNTGETEEAAKVAWAHARHVLTEVLLLSPHDLREDTAANGDRSIYYLGREMYRHRAERYPEKCLLFADWLFTAEVSHGFREDGN